MRFFGKIFPILRRTEQDILSAVVDAGDPDWADHIRSQVDRIRLVQRNSGNRMIVFFLARSGWTAIPQLAETETFVFKLKYSIEARNASSKFVFYKGRISSLETRKGFTNAELRGGAVIVSIKRDTGPPRLAEVIDRYEHGDEQSEIR